MTSIIEAKIVSFAEETAKPVGGGGPASETYTVYRINMLHWDFTCMELYEWKLAKRFRLFDKLRRDMVAAHGSLPRNIRFPLKVSSFVSMDRNALCFKRCGQLERFLAGLLSWQPESQVLKTFLDIRGGRVDEMASIGKKKKSITAHTSRELHHAQSVVVKGAHRRYLTPPAEMPTVSEVAADAVSAKTMRGKSNSALGQDSNSTADLDPAVHENRPSDVVLAAAGVAQLLEANKEKRLAVTLW